jgi:hypothetical protein
MYPLLCQYTGIIRTCLPGMHNLYAVFQPGGTQLFFHSIGQRIIPVRSIPMRRKPNHTAHLLLNLSFVPQIRNNPAHQSRVQALPG